MPYNFLYKYTWAKKWVDSYTKHPVYAINSNISGESGYYLYWITIKKEGPKTKNGAWMVVLPIGIIYL